MLCECDDCNTAIIELVAVEITVSPLRRNSWAWHEIRAIPQINFARRWALQPAVIVQMRKRFVGARPVQKPAQLVPAVAGLPTYD